MVSGNRRSFVADTEDEAVRLAMLCKLNGTNDQDTVRQILDNITISEAIDLYIKERSNILSPSTIKGYKSVQKHRFQDIMDCKLSENINWQRVINNEAGEVKAKTVKNSWGLLSAVLRANNIKVDGVRLPQIIRSEHEFLQPDQVKILVKAIEGHRFEIPYLLCMHGLRRSEACAVTKKDIKDGYIFVSGAKVYNDEGKLVERKENKTSQSNRKVPIMLQRLTDLVAEYDGEYLCPYKPSILTHPLNTVCRQNDLPEVGLHGLRHSFASLCYHLGISELQCMEYGGWSDINVMRKIYTHLAENDRSDAEKKLKEFFL